MIARKALLSAVLGGVVGVVSAGCSSPGYELIERGNERYAEGKLEEALQAYTSARRANPDSIEIRLEIAAIDLALDRPEEAINELNAVLFLIREGATDVQAPRSLARRPSDVPRILARAYLLRSKARSKLGLVDLAIEDLEKGREIDPWDPEARRWHFEALLAERLDKQAGALIARDPEYVVPRLLLAIRDLFERDQQTVAPAFATLSSEIPESATLRDLTSLARELPRLEDPALRQHREPSPLENPAGTDRTALLLSAWEAEASSPDRAPELYLRSVREPVKPDPVLQDLIRESGMTAAAQAAFGELDGELLKLARHRVTQLPPTLPDRAAPMLEVDPESLLPVLDPAHVVITGTATDDFYVDRVLVNGGEAILRRPLEDETRDLVQFVATVRLDGETRVRVECVDVAGRRARPIEHELEVAPKRDEVTVFPDRWGLFVSVSRFESKLIPDRSSIASASQSFMDRLLMGIPPDQRSVLVDTEATHQAIGSALDGLVAQSNARGARELLVYLDLPYWAAPQRLDLIPALLPFDADPKNFYESALLYPSVETSLQRSKADRIVLIVATPRDRQLAARLLPGGVGRVSVFADDSLASSSSAAVSERFVRALRDSVDELSRAGPPFRIRLPGRAKTPLDFVVLGYREALGSRPREVSLYDVVQSATRRLSVLTDQRQQPWIGGDTQALVNLALPRVDELSQVYERLRSDLFASRISRAAFLGGVRRLHDDATGRGHLQDEDLWLYLRGTVPLSEVDRRLASQAGEAD